MGRCPGRNQTKGRKRSSTFVGIGGDYSLTGVRGISAPVDRRQTGCGWSLLPLSAELASSSIRPYPLSISSFNRSVNRAAGAPSTKVGLGRL
jgi:hypothetical protein